jgi:hypothetical protein
MEQSNPKIGVVTFNTGGVRYCGKNKKSIGCKTSNFIADVIEYLARTNCDLVVIGLQEYSAPFSDLYDAFEFGFSDLNYKVISQTSQMGFGKELFRKLQLIILVNTYSKFKFKIRDETLDYRCGHQTIGKGAIGVLLNVVDPMTVSDHLLYIITTHLPFDDKRPQQANQDRIDCLNGMIEKFKIESNNSVLIFGDLNFRIKLDYDVQIEEFLKDNLWLKDSVSVAKSKNINVIKTCKLVVERDVEKCKETNYNSCYDVGTDKKPRNPSYCDRILFSSDLDLDQYETFDIGGTTYTDHLLVAGIFTYDISSDQEEFIEI